MDSLIIYISDTARLYFYATLLSADVTLISIFGLFIVFKVQFFQTLASNFREDLYKAAGSDYQSRIDAFNFDYAPQEERDNVITHEILMDAKKINEEVNWNKFNLLINDKFSLYLMNKAKLPMFLFLLGIIWNIAGIVYLNDLNYNQHDKTPEVILVYMACAYQVGILIYMAFVINKYILADRWKKEVSLLENRKIKDLKKQTIRLKKQMGNR